MPKLPSQVALIMLLLVCACAQAFERHHCTEKWHDHAIGKATKQSVTRSQTCKNREKDTLRLGYYQVIEHKAYWLFSNKERHSNCAGTGPGALGQLLNPECYLPSKLQRHDVDEYREYWLVSEDGDHFHTAPTQQSTLAGWQQNEISRYGVDSQAVYLNSNQIIGADPSTFEVIFPFGHDAKWDQYYFAKDANHLYADGMVMPDMNLSKIEWFELPCTNKTNGCDTMVKRHVNIGKIGQDVLYLRYAHRATLFKNVVTADFECFQHDYRHYCRSEGQYYEFKPDFDNEAKMIAIDNPAAQ